MQCLVFSMCSNMIKLLNELKVSGPEKQNNLDAVVQTLSEVLHVKGESWETRGGRKDLVVC